MKKSKKTMVAAADQSKTPIAVLISDVHYSIKTLELADAAIRMALTKANELGVKLIVAGDLHDSKANLRAECVNRMLDTFSMANSPARILIGNHDKINEKSEGHALEFLSFAWLHAHPTIKDGVYLIPYQHDVEFLKNHLKTIPKGSIVIMHQGVQGSDSGEYIQDRTALPKECFDGLRVISGHYHKRQDIKCGETGLFSYIGNPYTLNYAEANDPKKGFQILYSDGSLEFVPTNLRRHIIYDITIQQYRTAPYALVTGSDLVWFKIRGTKEELAGFKKPPGNIRLELIPTDTTPTFKQPNEAPAQELLDSAIDTLTNTSAERKERLKQTWRKLCES